MKKLLFQIIASIAGLWLATIVVPGVKLTGPAQILALAGLIFGLLNYFIKPVLNSIAFPLRIITLNFFSIIISMGLLWAVDLITQDLSVVQGLSVKGLLPLFWTTVMILAISYILNSFLKKSPEKNTK